RITVRARVARSNDENGLQRFVDPEPGLAAEIARRADREVAEAAERLANSLSGEYEAACDDTLERMQAELESRRDAEVAARAAERPEELGVLSGTRVDDGPVRSDELGADEVVAREAVLRRQVADAAAECQPRNARRAHDAAWWDQPDRLRRRIEVEPGRAAGGPCDASLAVDVDGAHQGQVDHEAVVDGAMPRRIVAAPAHRHLQFVRAREVEGDRDVAGTQATCNQRRPPVDEGVEAAARGVVIRIGGQDDRALERPPQLVDDRAHEPDRRRAAAVARG